MQMQMQMRMMVVGDERKHGQSEDSAALMLMLRMLRT